uniref:Reverse transcriptase domain-containing protein n=1 Tax=Tanacetum cinerariifolium TaxID=118510 RepID=A0A6L2KRQ1_TANCI|nr:reverse transcriptase domain-containing protein [Tanacetum cinerariifolium]
MKHPQLYGYGRKDHWISRTIMIEGDPFNKEHRLNECKHIEPVKQKKRGLALEQNEAAFREVEELLKADILYKVKYQTWVANLAMIKKRDRR